MNDKPMRDENLKNGPQAAPEAYEHQDLRPAGILYFLLTLGLAVVIALVGLRGLYSFLDRQARASQPPVSPLITNIPEDTRHVAPGYPQSVFPSPKLEEDERGQLNSIRRAEDETLYSYGWVDEKAGTVRIPIDRAMDLLVERGLPVRSQGTAEQNSGAKAAPSKAEAAVKKGEKK